MGNTCTNDYCLKRQTNKIPIYSLKGHFRCKVVDVYDGDTVTIVLYVNGEYQKHKLRMYGYDSPEMHPRKNIINRDYVIQKATLAKDFMKDLVLDKICIFESMGYDKYGRLLGNLYLSELYMKGKCVNFIMLENKHGYEYSGGTKRKNTMDELMNEEDATTTAY